MNFRPASRTFCDWKCAWKWKVRLWHLFHKAARVVVTTNANALKKKEIHKNNAGICLSVWGLRIMVETLRRITRKYFNIWQKYVLSVEHDIRWTIAFSARESSVYLKNGKETVHSQICTWLSGQRTAPDNLRSEMVRQYHKLVTQNSRRFLVDAIRCGKLLVTPITALP